MWQDWECAAGELIESTCTPTPISALSLATACGFAVCPTIGTARITGTTIFVDRWASRNRQHAYVAHELGHFALARHELPDSEEGAWWIAGALMLPRRDFDADLRRLGWSLPALRARHINATATTIAIRITQLRDAVVTVFDGNRVKRRVWSPWIYESKWLRRRTHFERNLAQRALLAGETVHEDSLCYAVPIGEREQHVIVVCDFEQLSLRL